MRPLAAILIGVLVLASTASSRADEAGLQALVAGGHVAMIRHALTTPGHADPLGFQLDDCATQRNLIEEGREEARRFGQLLRENGVQVDRVLSSEWCRCLETARLIEMGEVEISTALNNLYGRPQNRAEQVRGMREIVSTWQGRGNLLLVTHGANFGALLGINPDTTAGVVFKPAPETNDGFELIGRIGPDADAR